MGHKTSLASTLISDFLALIRTQLTDRKEKMSSGVEPSAPQNITITPLLRRLWPSPGENKVTASSWKGLPDEAGRETQSNLGRNPHTRKNNAKEDANTKNAPPAHTRTLTSSLASQLIA